VRHDGSTERLTEGGIALGMFDHATYTTGRVTLQPDDLLAIYSDGITEAENPRGVPFDEAGLGATLRACCQDRLSSIGAAVVHAVEQHTGDKRFVDDLTILLLRRSVVPSVAAV